MSNQILLQQLNQLCKALKKEGLWTQKEPESHQLTSEQPFSVDVMDFEQWLQWIFIPKLKMLASQEQACSLPHQSDVSTMAAHVFSSYTQSTQDVIDCLKQIDHYLNQR